MTCNGRFLVATPLITDPNFAHTVVYVYAHDEGAGAAGVVVNRPTEEPTVDYLPEWRSVLAAPPAVFWGGPVAQESGVVIVVRDGAIELIADSEPPTGVRARLFVGQAGWGPEQLEMELAEGAWLVVDARPDDVLSAFPEGLWSAILRRQGGRQAMWATHPLDPSAN
ncbi:YqgE/AlgH family protein [soil metagenome]